MYKKQDLTGQDFGTIKVLGFAGRDTNFKRYWKCLCLRCGRVMKKSTSCLKMGCVSCVKNKGKESGTKLYDVWRSIIRRCLNKKAQAYKLYGNRGIKVSNNWKDFKFFKKWALKSGYKDGLEIDRIDVNGDYCSKNCRWVNNRIQSNNRRNNRCFEIKGITNTLSEWARIYGKNYGTVRSRINNGWNIEDALKTKVDKRIGQFQVEKYTINGIDKSFYDWCEVFQVNTRTVKKRMKRGMSLAEALGVSV